MRSALILRKADSTLRSSQAVPHPSTNRALRRLTSEVKRDLVHSTRYGRRRTSSVVTHFSRGLMLVHHVKKISSPGIEPGLSRPRRDVLYVSEANAPNSQIIAHYAYMVLDNSATGTRTRVARVRAEYPNQLDYSGAQHHYEC